MDKHLALVCPQCNKQVLKSRSDIDRDGAIADTICTHCGNRVPKTEFIKQLRKMSGVEEFRASLRRK